MADLARHLRRPERTAHQRCFVRRLLGLAAAGFAAGAGLGVALLGADSFGLAALVAADASPLLAAALLVGGLGLLFMPASLATGLADPRRSPQTDPQDITVTEGRRR